VRLQQGLHLRLIYAHLAGHLRQLPAPDGRQATRFDVAQRLCIVSSLPILEKGEQFPRVICILVLLCSHYKISL
jgi:hypothetical protein